LVPAKGLRRGGDFDVQDYVYEIRNLKKEGSESCGGWVVQRGELER
jgi:hypothetical protein